MRRRRIEPGRQSFPQLNEFAILTDEFQVRFEFCPELRIGNPRGIVKPFFRRTAAVQNRRGGFRADARYARIDTNVLVKSVNHYPTIS